MRPNSQRAGIFFSIGLPVLGGQACKSTVRSQQLGQVCVSVGQELCRLLRQAGNSVRAGLCLLLLTRARGAGTVPTLSLIAPWVGLWLRP